MNLYAEQSLNTMDGGAISAREVIARAVERIQRYFRRPRRQQLDREQKLRLDERQKERGRIACELHDTLFQGFLGASLVLHNAVEGMPADSPSKPSLSRALHLMRRVIDEGRHALQGLRSPETASTSLEQSLSEFADEFTPGGARFRIFVMGQPKALQPAIHEQVYLIVQEALVNALRHSGAASIEAEVEYLPNKLRAVVRDNGSGIDAQVLRFGRDSHWGLLGMRERARGIGAQLRILSRRGAGTEVEVSVPTDISADAHAYVPKSPALQNEAVA
jgi:signal transduction histidine kinase